MMNRLTNDTLLSLDNSKAKAKRRIGDAGSSEEIDAKFR
jgi:hypothetical protein